MAKTKSSWRKRRWQIFLSEYQTNPDLRTELERTSGSPGLVYRVLAKYTVPPECISAVLRYLDNPKLPDKEYAALVSPSFYYMNMVVDKAGPRHDDYLYDSGERSAKAFIEHQLRNTELSKGAVDAVAYKIFGAFTALLVSPFAKKQELHDFIDEYWDELEPIINTPFSDVKGVGAYSYEQIITIQKNLAGKIYPAKTTRNRERDNLIIELTAQGLKDNEIATKLGEAGYGYLETNNIRQIRYRLSRKDVT